MGKNGVKNIIWKCMKTTGIIFLILVSVILVLNVNGDIGVPASKLEDEARTSARIEDDWEVVSDTSEEMSAMIFYSSDVQNCKLSVYVNNPGLSFGYFFRYGGSLPDEDGVFEIGNAQYDTKALLSANQQQISKIIVYNTEGIREIKVDGSKPFVVVLPANSRIDAFDASDNLVDTERIAL